jgi:hypothetical protein
MLQISAPEETPKAKEEPKAKPTESESNKQPASSSPAKDRSRSPPKTPKTPKTPPHSTQSITSTDIDDWITLPVQTLFDQLANHIRDPEVKTLNKPSAPKLLSMVFKNLKMPYITQEEIRRLRKRQLTRRK